MSDLLGKIQRGLKKPPSYITARLVHEARAAAEVHLAPRRVAALSPQKLCHVLKADSIDELWARLARRPYPFLPSDVHPQTLDALCPGDLARIHRQADDAMARRVDLLGSGPTDLGKPTDWSRDFKTGRRWPNAFFRKIEYANLGEPSDVKVPWELSRLQWLLPLGQRYVLEGDDRDAAAVREILAEWIDANPYAASVNWTCTMEAALRILTFTWLFHALHASPAFTDPAFRSKFLTSLYLHADFTERNIERSDVNGNHFSADAAALVFAGLFFGDGAAPQRWLRMGMRELSREVLLQVFPDGVDFEASVPYHRLNCELFALPAIYAQCFGVPVADSWRVRLSAMGRFAAAYSRNDGGSPVWGDNDNARALPMAQVQDSFGDHRYLLGLVGWHFKDAALLARFSGPVNEIYWLCGPAAAQSLIGNQPPPRASEAFSDGGFFVLAHKDDHVFVDCGPLGLAGRGGHGHNDLLSFEAALDGQLLVVDSGCLAYTSSVEERNLFRSTVYHNTPCVDRQEINRFIRPDYLWTLHDDAKFNVIARHFDDDRSELTVGHTGYQRLSDPVAVTRKFILDHRSGTLSIDDHISGVGSHALAIPLHLHPDLEAAPDGPHAFRLSTPRGQFRLGWSGTIGWRPKLESSRFAPSFGVSSPATRVVWSFDGQLPATLHVSLKRISV